MLSLRSVLKSTRVKREIRRKRIPKRFQRQSVLFIFIKTMAVHGRRRIKKKN